MRSAPCWRPHYWALTVPDRPTPNFLHHHSRVREATDGAKAEMSRLSARRAALGNELASAPFWPVLVLLLSHHGYGQMRENRLEILIDQPSQVVGRTVDYLARVGMVCDAGKRPALAGTDRPRSGPGVRFARTN
jgi:hypothetical protein